MSASVRQGLAASIEADRAELLAAYERDLMAIDSPIARDPQSRRQAMANAAMTLADLVESLRVGEVQVDDGYKLLAWDIGMARAAHGVHPRFSLEAASVFFETAVNWAVRYLGADEESLQLFMLIVLVVNQSINVRIREAATTYSGYLLNKIHEAHVEERRRIARELHDRIGHGMSYAHQQLELYDLHRTTEPVRASTRVSTAQQAIQETMLSLRAVTSGLRLLEPLKSLEKALLSYLERAQDDDVSIRLRVNGDEDWAPPAVRDEVFLVVREAVRNALNHARPTMVLIRIDIAPHELRASVEDDGMGFDPHRISGGVGLATMKERGQLMGGMVTISTQPGRGTHVDLFVPLSGTAK